MPPLLTANLLIAQNGCSAGGNGGSPRTPLVTAATTAVQANIPGYAAGDVVVTCPTGYDNKAVKVDLRGTAPSYFGVANLNPKTSSVAANGQIVTTRYSVALLDPSNPTWSGGGTRNGCPSYEINGGVTVTYEGSVYVNSTCTRADSNNGAVKAGNGAFTMTMSNGATLRIAGEASSGTAARVAPAPVENATPSISDPLAGLVAPCHGTVVTGCLGPSALPARNTATNGTGQCAAPNADPCILLPGTYSGGIQAR